MRHVQISAIMPEILVHRQNRVQDLEALNPAYGAEIDIRSRGGALILILLCQEAPWKPTCLAIPKPIQSVC